MDSKLHLELIQREIDFYIKLKNTRDSLWSNRLSIWIKKIIDKNDKQKQKIQSALNK